MPESITRGTGLGQRDSAGTGRQILAVVLIVALCDVTVYWGRGFAGVSVLLLLAPALLFLGTIRPQWKRSVWLVVAMLAILAARLLWLGSALGVACGLALLVALAIALQGRKPYVLTVAGGAMMAVIDGYRGLLDFGAWAAHGGARSRRVQWLAWALPLVAVVFFGVLFVMANPDLVHQVVATLKVWGEAIKNWWMRLPFHLREVLFWLAVAWFVAGLLRPRTRANESEQDQQRMVASRERALLAESEESPLYRPLRNTLLSVIVLFALYLVFEFRTLWFREFPQGFYYAGYAHQCAAWLTAALAFATLTLSLIFRGPLLSDRRMPALRRLAWIWSAENLVLALTVFNRLHIYIDFNGMTRMRMVALFGTTTVVAGFALVVWKIIRSHDFVWLVRHQLAALAVAIYVFAITPIDALVHKYNVRHVLAGDLPPAVQIAVHPTNAEGVLMLTPLLDCTDATIRDGVRALFACHADQLKDRIETLPADPEWLEWTRYQASDHVCLRHLSNCQQKWDEFRDQRRRQEALSAFYRYAYQWY